MCTEDDREEWEMRGKRWRKALGEFVWDGNPWKPVEAMDGVEVSD
jgi:hypothetical protein